MIGIVAHTARLDQANALADTVNATYISVDDGTLGCNANHKKVWTHLAEQSTEWSIVLEDDAIPVDNFLDQATQALAAAPGPIVSFYLGKHHIPQLDIEQDKQQAIARADAADAHWITGRHLFHAVAVAVRTDHTRPMLNHLNQLPDFFPIDEAICHWANNNFIDISYTWPSLIDHADLPTLFRHHDKLPRPPGRVAYRTGTRDTWTDKAVTL
jgi:GR25 family glycosyltransferase involved in LPS biosynthesis